MKVATIASNDLSFMQKGLQEFFQNSNKMNTELQVITNDMVDTPHNKVSSLEEDEVLVGIKDRVSPHYTFISHKDDVYMWSSPELGTGVSLKNGFHFIGVNKKSDTFP